MISVKRDKLPIGVFWEGFLFPFKNFGTLFKILFLPIVLLLAISAGIMWLFAPGLPDFSNGGEVAGYLQAVSPALDIVNLLFVIFAIMIAVHIHRYIVRDEAPGWVVFRFWRYEFMYLLTSIVVTLVYIAAMLALFFGFWLLWGIPFEALQALLAHQPGQPAPSVPPPPTWLIVAGIVVFVVVIWAQIRLILMLPHAAVTGRISFATSWSAMKGNFWRFVLAAILFGLLLLAVVAIFYLAAIFIIPAVLGVPFNLPQPGVAMAPEEVRGMVVSMLILYGAAIPIWILYVSAGVAFISYAYAYLVGRPAEA